MALHFKKGNKPMKLKEWLQIKQPLLKDNDFLTIYAIEETRNGHKWQHNVTLKQIKEKPQLLNVDIITQKDYDTQYNYVGGNSGTCKQYSCVLDFDQYYLSIYGKPKEQPKTRKNKRFKL